MPFVPTANMRLVNRPRPGPRVIVKVGKGGWNDFPRIIAAMPDALSQIVVATTEELANIATAMAPTQQNPRPGDPSPGTLKRSKRTRYFRRRGSDLVQTGRAEWPAKDPRGHRYAKPVETGSYRRGRVGKVTKGSGWLVDAVMAERPVFMRRLRNLEASL